MSLVAYAPREPCKARGEPVRAPRFVRYRAAARRLSRCAVRAQTNRLIGHQITMPQAFPMTSLSSGSHGKPSILIHIHSQDAMMLSGIRFVDDHWVHSSVARAADCRSAGPWLKSECALYSTRVRYLVELLRRCHCP